jgi:hypothetical protein
MDDETVKRFLEETTALVVKYRGSMVAVVVAIGADRVDDESFMLGDQIHIVCNHARAGIDLLRRAGRGAVLEHKGALEHKGEN